MESGFDGKIFWSQVDVYDLGGNMWVLTICINGLYKCVVYSCCQGLVFCNNFTVWWVWFIKWKTFVTNAEKVMGISSGESVDYIKMKSMF